MCTTERECRGAVVPLHGPQSFGKQREIDVKKGTREAVELSFIRLWIRSKSCLKCFLENRK